MIINEKKGNIFALSKEEYVFAHCIATDLQWGAGIAPVMMKQFKASSKWRKNTNATVYNVGDIGVDVSNTGMMINLFTKSHTHGRPSYQAMEQCLVNLREWMIVHNKAKLAIPKIGCGLDGLSWPMVRDIINRVFLETDIMIEVRYL